MCLFFSLSLCFSPLMVLVVPARSHSSFRLSISEQVLKGWWILGCFLIPPKLTQTCHKKRELIHLPETRNVNNKQPASPPFLIQLKSFKNFFFQNLQQFKRVKRKLLAPQLINMFWTTHPKIITTSDLNPTPNTLMLSAIGTTRVFTALFCKSSVQAKFFLLRKGSVNYCNSKNAWLW